MKRTTWLFGAFLLTVLASCAREADLVVYCALDQEFAEPMIRRYEKESGLTVRAEFDIEANKTVGLVQRLREESKRPRCDVFWNNETAHSARLAQDGFLARYASPNAAAIPTHFKDADAQWTGFAARARILIVNTDLADPKSITSMWDVVDPKWAGKVAMARPLTGTTLTHMAALYTVLGDAKAEEYVTRVHELGKSGALQLANGNATVARMVSEGKVAFGWTDTDDFAVQLEKGAHVAAVYPDADGVGTLLIPNSIVVLKDAPHAENARRFVDWVLRPETEKELAFARSAQIPVRADVPRPPSVVTADQFKAMTVDFRAVGAQLEARAEHFKQLFLD
ncbi:MAG: extracellular solute-binding protein [Planctomycetes bacterium]|nr:extracellular solute-binding protein [Planctomycetota bacterium]